VNVFAAGVVAQLVGDAIAFLKAHSDATGLSVFVYLALAAHRRLLGKVVGRLLHFHLAHTCAIHVDRRVVATSEDPLFTLIVV
jgi:hypothetical protein